MCIALCASLFIVGPCSHICALYLCPVRPAVFHLFIYCVNLVCIVCAPLPLFITSYYPIAPLFLITHAAFPTYLALIPFPVYLFVLLYYLVVLVWVGTFWGMVATLGTWHSPLPYCILLLLPSCDCPCPLPMPWPYCGAWWEHLVTVVLQNYPHLPLFFPLFLLLLLFILGWEVCAYLPALRPCAPSLLLFYLPYLVICLLYPYTFACPCWPSIIYPCVLLPRACHSHIVVSLCEHCLPPPPTPATLCVPFPPHPLLYCCCQPQFVPCCPSSPTPPHPLALHVLVGIPHLPYWIDWGRLPCCTLFCCCLLYCCIVLLLPMSTTLTEVLYACLGFYYTYYYITYFLCAYHCWVLILSTCDIYPVLLLLLPFFPIMGGGLTGLYSFLFLLEEGLPILVYYPLLLLLLLLCAIIIILVGPGQLGTWRTPYCAVPAQTLPLCHLLYYCVYTLYCIVTVVICLPYYHIILVGTLLEPLPLLYYYSTPFTYCNLLPTVLPLYCYFICGGPITCCYSYIVIVCVFLYPSFSPLYLCIPTTCPLLCSCCLWPHCAMYLTTIFVFPYHPCPFVTCNMRSYSALLLPHITTMVYATTLLPFPVITVPDVTIYPHYRFVPPPLVVFYRLTFTHCYCVPV